MSKVAYNVNNGLAPHDKPLAITFDLDFTATTEHVIDLLLEETNGVIDNLQTLFIDNADNGSPLTLKFGVSGQRLVFPSNAQGYVAVAFSSPHITVTTDGAAKIQIIGFNVPMAGHVWSAV